VTANPRVSIVSLGCSRNDVDSEELAGRLTADGWNLVSDGEATDLLNKQKKTQLTPFWKPANYLLETEKS
jgi:hypothetical protein